jgi:hypothetical protein
MSIYKSIIERLARDIDVDVDPRHVEGYMRLQYGTLDHLSAETFKEEIYLSQELIKAEGIAAAESCARSYGL